VPAVCVIDPDGDLVEYLHASGAAERHPTWACYHTSLATFRLDGVECGILGRVVGAPFAVLVAEELFASDCQLLISITSAGQTVSLGPPPYVVLIDKALRDEGTSYHYLPPSPFSGLRRTAMSAGIDPSGAGNHIVRRLVVEMVVQQGLPETFSLRKGPKFSLFKPIFWWRRLGSNQRREAYEFLAVGFATDRGRSLSAGFWRKQAKN
jgi:hypothetical protein